MALKDVLKRVTVDQHERDREELRKFCSEQRDQQEAGTLIGDLVPRRYSRVTGEISSLRVVPARDGSSWLEASVTDGTGTLVVLWMGRRRIAGVRPGSRLVVAGRPTPAGRTGRPTLYNPEYRLLA